MRPVQIDTIAGSPRSAYWSLPATRADALTGQFPAGTSHLYLCPKRTTPNVVLGIELEDGTIHFMSPGDIFAIPRSTQARVWNPIRGWYYPTVLFPTVLVGFLGLMSCNPAEALALMSSRPDTQQPLPAAAAIAAGRFPTNLELCVPTLNLRAVRVSVQGISSVNGGVGQIPADFVGGVNVGYKITTPLLTIAAWDGITPDAIEILDLLSPARIGSGFDKMPDASQNLTPIPSADVRFPVNAAGTKRTTFEIPVNVGCGGLILRPWITAGTGLALTGLGLIVEGR